MSNNNRYQIKSNWKLELENQKISDCFILFINDDDSVDLNCGDDGVSLYKDESITDDQSTSCTVDIAFQSLLKISSIYIESQSRVQEFFVNNGDYIGTCKSSLLEDAIYSSEYNPPSSIPIKNISINFCSLYQKNKIKIFKMIIDAQIINESQTQPQTQPQPQQAISQQAMNHGISSTMMGLQNLSLNSAFNFPKVSTSTPLPPNLFMPPSPAAQSHQLNNGNNNNLEMIMLIKNMMSESEKRIETMINNKFDKLMDKMNELEEKIDKMEMDK
ncbi:hypothetical protein CYY_004794 [Polysphondylium violaceum]|uniref:Uncharacterized protein n=1 Tax=Polysphondylium violaceum TaxID=133409 RepID=A0A8J4USQ8_9MYCE|nr:hypothetical protein CYY_004794 [Polysphondylium violaceum]